MADQIAQRDPNRVPALLVHDSTGAETRQVRSTVANPNTVPVEVVAGTTQTATSIGDGRKTVSTGGTAEALASSTSCKSVAITAETDNTGVIVVGGSTVVAALATRRGIPLNAGDSTVIDIDDLAKIYLDTTVNGDGVTYTYTS